MGVFMGDGTKAEGEIADVVREIAGDAPQATRGMVGRAAKAGILAERARWEAATGSPDADHAGSVRGSLRVALRCGEDESEYDAVRRLRASSYPVRQLDVGWDRDPAASGWRWRAFLDGGWELLAYDDGRWEVRHGSAVASGREADSTSARHRVVKVYAAYSCDLA